MKDKTGKAPRTCYNKNNSSYYREMDTFAGRKMISKGIQCFREMLLSSRYANYREFPDIQNHHHRVASKFLIVVNEEFDRNETHVSIE